MSTPLATMGALLTVAILLGCRDQRPHDRPIERDSAGISIVENAGDQLDALPVWSVEEKPDLTIGVVMGASEYELDRVVNAVRLTDGRIAVLNGGTNEIRFYDPGGRYLRSVGGTGQGPGEFSWPVSMNRTTGDSLRVYDHRLKRLTTISPNGNVSVRSIRVPLSGLLGFLTPDVMVNVSLAYPRNTQGAVSVSVVYEMLNLGTGLSDTVEIGNPRPEYASVQGLERIQTAVPFTVHPTGALGDGFLYISDNAKPEVRVFDRSGELTHKFRIRADIEPLSRSEFHEAVRRELAGVKASLRPHLSRIYEEMQPPKNKPANAGILVDRIGQLWLLRYDAIPDGPYKWLVLSPAGRLMARVETTRALRIFEIGEDYVLGLHTDPDGSESIQLFRLTKHQPEGN